MNDSEKVSRSTRFYYGFGSVAYGAKDSGFGYFLLFYYNAVLGLPGHLASSAIFIALVVDAFSDPIVGNLSDRLHSRWGRRHPFMYLSAIPVAFAFYALWNPPELDEMGLFYYLLGTAVLVRTFITFYEVPSTALAPELTSDYDERTKLSSARHFFGWIGGITLTVLMYGVLMESTPEYKDAQYNPAAYDAYGWVGAVVMFIAVMTSAIGTHRHIPDLMKPPPRRRISLSKTFRESRETLSGRSFYAVFGFGLFLAMAGGLSGSMSLYLYTYFWGLRPDQIVMIVPSGIASALIALFAAPVAAERFGKRRAAIFLSIFAAAFAPTTYVARFAGIMPENGSTELLAVLMTYNIIEIGFIITSTTLVSAMMADVVEESELKTGRRSEGLFFAARSFISKSVTGLGIILGTLLLGFVNFPKDARPGEVDSTIIMNLGVGYIPMIVGLYALAIVCLSAYDITREQHLANVKEVKSRRDAAAEAFSPTQHDANFALRSDTT